MARAKGGIFGKITGKIGNVSVRNVNGKTIISARPQHFKVSQEPQCIETRQKFAVAIAFAQGVSCLPTLREIWKLNKGSNFSGYRAILTHNIRFISSESPSMTNLITPYGFYSPIKDVSITNDKLTGSLASFDTCIKLSPEETNLSINALVSLSGPKEANEPFFKVIASSKEIPGFEFNKQNDFEIIFSVEDEDQIAKYNQKIIYIAVVTKTKYKEIIRYSQSYSKLAE